MPTYDYECGRCGHTFDAFQSMSDEPLRKCPSCGKSSLRRLIGGGLGVIFKGSGFYVNDSRSSGSGSKAKTAAASSTSESSDSKTADTKAADTKTADAKSRTDTAKTDGKSAAAKAAS